MSKKNLEDELKNTKDALQCEIEFSSTRKLEIKRLQTTLLEVTHTDILEGPKLQMKKETEIDDTRFTSLMEACKVNVINKAVLYIMFLRQNST